MDSEVINVKKINPINNGQKILFSVYLANLFLSFHFFLILYINSSFLKENFSSTGLSLLFMAGAIASLILLIKAPLLIKNIGNYLLTLIFIVIEAVAILGLAFLTNPVTISIFFILHQASATLVFFNLDIFLEAYSSDESKTGGIRGVFLTVANIVLVISPMITGFILSNGDYSKVYLISAVFLIPLFFTIKLGLKREKIENTEHIKIKETLKTLLNDKNIYGVFMAQLILQFFYAWMVIYTPIHLHENLNFEWSEIGLMFTIMLLPFVLFEIPLGSLADKKLGEKEIMTFGFIIIAFFVALIPILNKPDFLIWTVLLFMTRVGASFVEISSESYFFKHVNSGDSNIISLFRMTRPVSFLFAPALAAFTLFFTKKFGLDYSLSFIALAIIVFYGIRYSLMIKDTK